MEHIGIELGAKTSHLVVFDQSGALLLRTSVRTPALGAWLRGRPMSRVVMESCTQSHAVARLSQQAKHTTVVIPRTVVRALGIGRRGIKTDDKDAETLALASVRNQDLPSVHLRSVASRSHHETVTARALLVRARTRVITHIKSWLRGRLVHLKTKASKTFSQTVRELALEHNEGIPISLDVLLASHDTLSEQIERLDATMIQLAADHAICRRMMTIPGVGPVVALSFVAHVDDIARFETAEQLASYFALVPGEATTGGKLKRTGTIKSGPTYMKSLLIQAAWSHWRSAAMSPPALWAKALGERRGKRIAIVALARKLTKMMFAMWRDQKEYRPRLPAQVSSTTPSSNVIDIGEMMIA